MGAEELVRRYGLGGGARSAHAAANIPIRPRLHTVVVTCMDARIDPVTLFALQAGDAHVLRNAGGIVTDDVVRSLTVSQRKLGTSQVLLVQHTDCGMVTFTDEAFTAELTAAAGRRPTWRPGTFRDPAESVAAGAARLRTDPFLRAGTVVRGFVVDVVTFALHEIPPAPAPSEPSRRRPTRRATRPRLRR